MLEVTTYIHESDCTTDLEKQLYQLALDYQQLAEAYDKERKRKANYAIDREYIESILGTSPIDDHLVIEINDEIWNNDTIVDLIHDVIQQHVNQ
jgi:predicted amino acid racemase